MAKLETLYAASVFDLAVKGGEIDKISKQARLMREVFLNPSCKKILVHPHISNVEKLEIFSKIFERQIHEYLKGLLHVIVTKNREGFMIPTLNALIEKINRHRKKTVAVVSAASKLGEKQVAEIKNILSKKLNKTVEVKIDIDEKLIGGPFIKVDGYHIDQTVKKRLFDMAVHMKEGCNE